MNTPVCTGCGRQLNSLDGNLCVYCRIDVSKATAKAAGRACPACGFDIKDGIFQCVACEMTAEKPMRKNHEYQEIALALLSERERLREYKGRRHRREVRNRLRKVNAKLKRAGLTQ